MPYILQYNRKILDEYLEPLFKQLQFYRIGHLNYIITKIILQWLNDYTKPVYKDYNEIIGVLECVKQEFYRRKVVPYEDEKIKENGDI